MRLKFLNIVLIVLFSSVAFGQKVFDTNPNLLEEFFANGQNERNEALFNGNSDQVFNTLLSITQLGEDNEVILRNRGVNQQHILQVGEENSFRFFSGKRTKLNSMKLWQLGDRNSLIVQGSNSLFANARIIQVSNFSTLLIRNF